MQKYPMLLLVSTVLGVAAAATLFVLQIKDEGKMPQTVRVGALLPLNTDLNAVAVRMQNGMDLAQQDLKAKYGENLNLTVDYQNGCFEHETAKAVQKFAHEGVSIISGSFCVFGHIPILPLIEAHRIVTFNTATNPDVVLNRRFAFSTNVEVKEQAADMADFAFNVLRTRRAVTMHLDTPFGRDYNKYFQRRFEELGGEVLFNIPNAPDGKDFGASIVRIKQVKPDVIVTAHFGVPLGLFFRGVRNAGIEAAILGNYETEDPDVLLAAGDAAEGVFVATTDTLKKTAAIRRFESRYIRKFGVEPDSIVTNSYDAMILGVDSAVVCKGDRDCMRKELHAVKNHHGMSGDISIGPTGATEKPTVFKVVRSRTFIDFGSGDPETEVSH